MRNSTNTNIFDMRYRLRSQLFAQTTNDLGGIHRYLLVHQVQYHAVLLGDYLKHQLLEEST